MTITEFLGGMLMMAGAVVTILSYPSKNIKTAIAGFISGMLLVAIGSAIMIGLFLN